MKRTLFLSLPLLVLAVAVGLYLTVGKKSEGGVPSGYKQVLSIKAEGFEVFLYTSDGTLKVGKNLLYLQTKPEKKIESLYFYMPPMPGMGEMREDALLKEISIGRYEGSANLSMAGYWQLVLQVDGKVYKQDLNIPYKPGAQREEKKEGLIEVKPSALQLVGIQTMPVEKKELLESFSVVGYVSYDLSRVYEVTLRSDAWVIDTFGRFEGELISKGEPLMRVLSPEVEVAKEELRLAKELGRRELERAVLEKLSYLKAGEVIGSPYSGVIIERKVSPGGYVKAGETAYRIADISKVWVVTEVPFIMASSIRRGMKVLITPVGSEESFEGLVDYIFPEANKESRTLRVKISLPNRSIKLKVNQLVEVYFEKPLGEALAVPESAVVDTGKRQVVFVEVEPGVYQPRFVKLGRRAEGYYEVLEGLKEGEKVVIKGTFLLHSEAQLKGLYGEEVKAHEHHH
jgi:Cu(I)/Ag(I) efflux system membrane fusion protein